MKNDEGMINKIMSMNESNNGSNRSINTTKIMLIIVAIFIALSSTVQIAEAAGTPTQIIVFSDKKVYPDWYSDGRQSGAKPLYLSVNTPAQTPYIYAIVLDNDGKLMEGRTLSVTIRDIARLDHYDKGTDTVHHSRTDTGGTFYNVAASLYDDGTNGDLNSGDGIYTYKWTPASRVGSTLIDDHLMINLTVTSGSLSANETILFSWINCHKGDVDPHPGTHSLNEGASALDGCTQCHIGYEHTFENKSNSIDELKKDRHLGKMNPIVPSMGGKGNPNFEWNLSGQQSPNGYGTTAWNVVYPGSEYCYWCHYNANGGSILDYGADRGSRADINERPSCSQASVTLSLGTVNCHATTKITGTAVPPWSPPGVNTASGAGEPLNKIISSTSHATNSVGNKTVACILCHLSVHSYQLPNRTSTNYTDISNRCNSCHSYSKHNNSVSCIVCHTNDSHYVRYLQQDRSYGNSTINAVYCMSCHTNSSFSPALGFSTPQVSVNHSMDGISGQKWGDYWTSNTQMAAAGGSNLITSSTVNVSSYSVLYGSATALSGAQIVDGILQNLTEGRRSVPPTNVDTYVTSNISYLGNIKNWNNILNASDSNATADFNETLPASRDPAIINGNFTIDNSSWEKTLLLTEGDNVPFNIIVFNTSSPQFNASRAYLMGKADNGEGNITQDFEITDLDLRRQINLTFKFRKFAALGPTSTHDFIVRLIRPNGTIYNAYTNTTVQPAGTSAWSTQNLNITSIIDQTGTWTLEIYHKISTENTNSAEGATDVDDINIAFPSPYSYGLVVENYFSNVPIADNYYLQMNYWAQGDSYNVYLYNGTVWNQRAVLNSSGFATINYTLQADEYNSGSPIVKIMDRNASASVQGNLSIDYMRIRGYTADTSHSEATLYHNFTGVTKYATEETVEYTLVIKGNATAAENLNIYVYDYDSGSYELVRESAFSTTNSWVNTSIPYSAISSSGNASVMFVDTNRTRYDNVNNSFYLDYVGIKTDNYRYLSCYYCHSISSNHKSKALASVEWIQSGPGGNNPKNSTALGSSYWCANCHYNGSVAGGSYRYNGSAWTNPPPPLINVNNVVRNSSSWYNHSSIISSNFTDASCKPCHGNAMSDTTKNFSHTVEIGVSGGVNCTSCHNIGGSSGYDVNFTAVNRSMHANLNNKSTSTGGNATNKPCWACHGTKNGTWANESDQPANGHNTTVYKNPRKCQDCHNDTSPMLSAKNVTDHIPYGLSPYTDVNTSSYNNTYCSNCHNNSVNNGNDSFMGLSSGGSPMNASTSHYGANKTAGKLMSSANNSTDCVYCHRNNSNMVKWGIIPGSLANISNKNGTAGTGTNHNSYTASSQCSGCHGGYTVAAGFTFHNSSLGNGSSGGPDCISCHNPSGSAGAGKLVNTSAMNSSSAIHKNLNSGASATVSGENKKCWACHGSGSQPLSGHPANYNTPYNCTNCHIPGAGQNFNYTPNSTLLNVTQHYWNGTSIRTPAATTCYLCHNRSEMMIGSNLDPDGPGSGTYGGANGGNNSTSHYGKNRTDLRTWNSSNAVNCSYCHQNASTAFVSAMINASYNSSISNHSSNYNSSNPSCTASQCHSTGWIHNSTLAKPAVNSTFCLLCHGSNGAGGTNYTGAVTGIKEKHNNSMNCSECHLSTTKDVHPVKYLRQDNTTSTMNTSAVNCITCHQTYSVDGALTLSPPKVPATMRHSDNTSNGTIWNSTAYWTPASPLTSCTYCHNDTKHNASALGRPAGWQGNNVVNSSISSGMWCASCHYKNYSSGAKNYSDMTQAFTSANLSVPPEITNGSYALNIYNRSDYYNHSLTDYSDAVCRLCHGVNISSTANISELMHNVTVVNTCTSCHYSFEAMNNTTRPDRYVDFSMYNTSLHRQLSCTNCHTQGHKNMGARKACEDCHAVQADPVNDKDRHNITATPSTYSVNGSNVVGITDCTTCHNGALYNLSISTYGYWKQKDCDYCHTYPDKYYE